VEKWAKISASEFTNSMNEVEDFVEYLSSFLGFPGIGQDCSKTLVCEFWAGLFCGPYFKCIPAPNYVVNDLFYDVKDVANIFNALDSGITESLNSKMTNDFCKEATRPFRPLLKALAASNDNWGGFFDTISLSTGVSVSGGSSDTAAEAGFAVDKKGDVACFYSVCSGITSSLDPSLGLGVSFGVGSGSVNAVAGKSLSLGIDAAFTAVSGGFSYSYANDNTKAFSGVGFSLGASIDAGVIKGLDFSASKAECVTTAKVVKYSQGLVSTEFNPYYYDNADTCRKIQKKGSSTIYLVIDRSIRVISDEFWSKWVVDKTFEILPDISMFSLEKQPLDSTARIVLDSVTW
jgi:hypothetical protein